MRWLFLKDLAILRRSRLLVALLVAYPIAVAILVGFALSRAPERPEVAVLNQVPESGATISLGSDEVDLSDYADQLFDAIEPVEVTSREEAVERVRDGDVLAALIIPPDVAQKLESGVEPAAIEVLYNAEDPAKRAFVESTIEAEVAAANAALTERYSEVATDYVDLLVRGGELSFLGQDVEVLGLQRAERVLRRAKSELPPASPARERIGEVIDFASVALTNAGLSDEALASIGRPIQVEASALEGGTTPLSSFAVAVAVSLSLMLLAILLAAGTLALEREENAFGRLLRGLVSRTALIAEKAALGAVCSGAVALAMLAGLAAFVELDWSRLPLWLLAIGAGAVAFAAAGAALGALAGEVRVASLLAVMLSLPLAFLALVPSGAVSDGLYEVIRAVSAAFPFEPALSAIDAALSDGGDIVPPLFHLVGLALAFAAAGRLALRRTG